LFCVLLFDIQPVRDKSIFSSQHFQIQMELNLLILINGYLTGGHLDFDICHSNSFYTYI